MQSAQSDAQSRRADRALCVVSRRIRAGRDGQWWKSFGDPDLDALIEQTFAGSLQLMAAWARLEQAGAVLRQASSGKWPTLEARLQGSRQAIRSPFADTDDAPPGLPETFTTSTFSASLAAAYEIDVWKRVGSAARAAALDAEALRNDAEAIALSLTAEVAEGWYDLVFARAQKKLLTEQIAVSETFLELVTLRFQQGLATSIDVNQQQLQLLANQSQIPLLDARIELAQNRLAALAGKPRAGAVGSERDQLPELPPLPGTGVPGDLLVRRPDVRAAQLRAEAADHRVAQAVADRLPSLRLSGSIGKQSGDIGEIFTVPTVWSIVGQLIAPLIDGGRRKAEVERNEAVVDERLADYGQALVSAIVEVDSAIEQEKQQVVYVTGLEQQVEVANAALQDAQARYREGLSEQGFLQVLTALQTQQRAELSLLSAERQLISYRIQLYRALGGTWTAELEPTRPQRREN